VRLAQFALARECSYGCEFSETHHVDDVAWPAWGH
jgi:hypothetical protein